MRNEIKMYCKVLLFVSALSSMAAFGDDSREKICFNKSDQAGSGMTSDEYYKAINSSCEREIKRAKLKVDLCFNNSDESGSGMTSQEYYHAINRSCDEIVTAAEHHRKGNRYLASVTGDLKGTICFNKADEFATGMTSDEYYRAIKSSCGEQVTMAKQE